MPYFLFEIESGTEYRLIDTCDDYRAARSAVRERRKQLPADTTLRVRMIFATDANQGRSLLSAKREARPMGEE